MSDLDLSTVKAPSWNTGDMRKYPHKKYKGKDATWYVCQFPEGDYCYHQSYPHYKEGYGGSTVEFLLEDGTTESVVGPFKWDGGSFSRDTGLDPLGPPLVRVIVCEKQESKYSLSSGMARNVLHDDGAFVLSTYDAAELAQKIADEKQLSLYLLVFYRGGATGRHVHPTNSEPWLKVKRQEAYFKRDNLTEQEQKWAEEYERDRGWRK